MDEQTNLRPFIFDAWFESPWMRRYRNYNPTTDPTMWDDLAEAQREDDAEFIG